MNLQNLKVVCHDDGNRVIVIGDPVQIYAFQAVGCPDYRDYTDFYGVPVLNADGSIEVLGLNQLSVLMDSVDLGEGKE